MSPFHLQPKILSNWFLLGHFSFFLFKERNGKFYLSQISFPGGSDSKHYAYVGSRVGKTRRAEWEKNMSKIREQNRGLNQEG